MDVYLLVDFGSTYTKLVAVDLEKEVIVGTSKASTTVSTNVLDGYDKAPAEANGQQGCTYQEIGRGSSFQESGIGYSHPIT